ncbi:MAG: hypothetical protein QXH41_04935 [Metallosphaera sp.]
MTSVGVIGEEKEEICKVTGKFPLKSKYEEYNPLSIANSLNFSSRYANSYMLLKD